MIIFHKLLANLFAITLSLSALRYKNPVKGIAMPTARSPMTERSGCTEQTPLPHVLKGVLNTERSTLLVSRVMPEPSSSLAPVHTRRSDGFKCKHKFYSSEKGASLSDIGYFFFQWPFSLKVIWAPIVDSLYFRSLDDAVPGFCHCRSSSAWPL